MTRHHVVTFLALCVQFGCQSLPSGQPLQPALAGSEPESQVEFWHALPSRNVVSHDEAFHALLLFTDGEDPAGDFDSRVQLLKDRHMLADDFAGGAEQAARRGTIAVALAKVLSINGGLSMHLIGPQPRYAVRELQYVGLFPQSSPHQTFSGSEFLGIIGRAEDYQRLHGGEQMTVEETADATAGQ